MLEKNGDTFTGKEIELGSTPFNLAQFANNSVNATTTQKLYVNGSKEMYIEIVVKSKPVDAKPQPKETVTPQTVVNLFNQSSVKRSQSKVEPVTPDDHEFVEEFKARENEYRQ